jgi:chromatin remodeling complex protein RSC6
MAGKKTAMKSSKKARTGPKSQKSATPVVEPTWTEEVQKTETQKQFEDLLNQLSSFKQQVTMLVNQVRSVERVCNKRMKVLEREAKKNRAKGNRKASGFAVPSPISAQLCKFMNKPTGTSMARTEVTKHIIQYISDHKLQNPNNKKVIKPDKALKSLLDIKKDSEAVTYFNIQRYMNKHFLNSKAATSSQ